jgi:hypothetical protein
MNKTLKLIKSYSLFVLIHTAFALLIYLGTIENVNGAQNILYVWVFLNLGISLICLAAYSAGDKHKKSAVESRSKVQRYASIPLNLLYSVVCLWNSFIVIGTVILLYYFIILVCHAQLDSYEKEQKEKLDALPSYVGKPSDVFPPGWEDI